MKNKYLDLTQTSMTWLAILACLSTWLPTAFMSVSAGIFTIVWLISGRYSVKMDQIRRNPAVMLSIALLLFYAIGLTYSSANLHDAFAFGSKYHKLLFIPMIASVLYSDKIRRIALYVFLAGAIATLILSYLKWLGLIPFHDTAQGYIVFKNRIAHNILMSYAMYLMLGCSLKSNGYIRLAWAALSMLAALNILFLVNGRTGQITMLALALWFAWEAWGVKSLKYWGAALIAGLILHQTIPNFPHSIFTNSRLANINQEIASGNQTSAGQRVEMYKNTFTLIQQHPIFGGGTGSLEGEYKVLVENKQSTLTPVNNPHNQFLLTTQELGLVGLLILLLMWALHWRASYQLNSPELGYALRGLVLTIAVGSLFNSLLLDASEGKFYCVLAGILLSAYSPKAARAH